jgi:hypothetical protein
LRNRKALDLIIENARVSDEEWREEEEAEAAVEASAEGSEAVTNEEQNLEAASEDETATKAESSSPGA